MRDLAAGGDRRDEGDEGGVRLPFGGGGGGGGAGLAGAVVGEEGARVRGEGRGEQAGGRGEEVEGLDVFRGGEGEDGFQGRRPRPGRG